MNFHPFTTTIDQMQIKEKPFVWYAREVPELFDKANKLPRSETKLLSGDRAAIRVRRLGMEWWWYREMRPYFKVWPCIRSILEKFPLDVNPETISQTTRIVAVRFCDDKSDNCKPYIRSILVGNSISEKTVYILPQLVIGEQTSTSLAFPAFFNDGTIESQIEKHSHKTIKGTAAIDVDETLDMLKKACRVAVSILLLADDPSIVQPDVLADDRRRFDESTDPELRQRLIDKARKRGIIGWRIGEKYETIPHSRRGHPHLFHTGKGRTVPKIIFVSPCIVHRQKMTDVPTGYMDEQGNEVEP